MRLTLALAANLNKAHWDRRVWEVGYRGTLMGKRKVTGKPERSIHPAWVKQLQDNFEREYTVMRWLCTPYLTKETEKEYIEKYGSFVDIRQREERNAALSKMPGTAKVLNTRGDALQHNANYGNLLHKPRTVEDSLSMLINKNRWD